MTENVRFVFTDDLCLSIKNHEKNENKRRNSSFNVEVFSPERCTECDRKILYDVYDGQAQTQISEAQNNLRHKWASLMMRMPNVILHGVAVEFSDVKYNLHGSVDMILEFENRDIKAIGMVREVDAETMSKIREKGPMRKDVLTDMMYMWLSEIPNAIMIYEDSKNREVEIYHAVPYNAIIETTREKFGRLVDYKLHGLNVERPYSNQDNKECSSCRHKVKCWKEK